MFVAGTAVLSAAILLFFIAPAMAQLTTGDMARLTDEQRYTLDAIENKVFWLTSLILVMLNASPYYTSGIPELRPGKKDDRRN